MSRVHDALKRAEEDRAVANVNRVEVIEPASVGPVAVQVTPVRETVPGDSSTDTSVTWDTLLARCTPQPWKPDLRTMLFFGEDGEEYGREEFRTLRSRLYQMRERLPLKIVLVASALPEEGRSFVAANLAQALARQSGWRVLLVDADFRRPGLHSMLGTVPAPGLSDYLLSEMDAHGVIQRGPMENLFFIPAGTPASSPAELAANGRLKTLLDRVEPLFDWIIVDSPPATAVSDASLLATKCDGVLMVARSSKTSFDTLRQAGREFPQQQLIGVVLNGTQGASSVHTRP
jgi:protein-tyrosine kinase